MVVFGQSGCIPEGAVVFGQNSLVWTKAVVFGQDLFYAGKLLSLWKIGCIRENWLYSGII